MPQPSAGCDRRSFLAGMAAMSAGLAALAPRKVVCCLDTACGDEPAAKPKPHATRIYTTARIDDDKANAFWLVAIDPETGEFTKVTPAQGCPRVSHDGRLLAYEYRNALWVCPLNGKDPRKVADLEQPNPCRAPSWSPDDTQLVISVGRLAGEPPKQSWSFQTFRYQVDGSGGAQLPLAQTDGVLDWSPDGKWLLVESTRDAPIGWMIDLISPDGTATKRLTESGNPFPARFSRDGKQILYTTFERGQGSGVWVMDADGKHKRKIYDLPQGTSAEACWSPDGRQIALVMDHIGNFNPEQDVPLLQLMDLDGEHRVQIPLTPGHSHLLADWW